MRLIKRIRKCGPSGRMRTYGVFWCPFCEENVERDLSNGLRCKSCGCAHTISGIDEYAEGDAEVNQTLLKGMKPAIRTCLMCNIEFDSAWPGNRRCLKCESLVPAIGEARRHRHWPGSTNKTIGWQ